MKVRIGKYPTWYSTQKLDTAWLKLRGKEDHCEEDRLDKIVFGAIDGIQTVLNVTINKFNEWRGKKRIKVRVDYWDTWSMDYTLALIAVPMLEQLRETKHGAPVTEDSDVPAELRTPEGYDYNDHGDVDENWFERWDWILGEMIFAMEKIRDSDSTWFHDNEIEKRVQNGCRLFGKYFRNLWD
jgi:hypothetical protein